MLISLAIEQPSFLKKFKKKLDSTVDKMLTYLVILWLFSESKSPKSTKSVKEKPEKEGKKEEKDSKKKSKKDNKEEDKSDDENVQKTVKAEIKSPLHSFFGKSLFQLIVCIT